MTDPQASVIVPPFTVTASVCDSTDISYSMQVVSADGHDTSFIVFNALTRTVMWETTDAL